jgi:hypothetical protein
MFLGIIQRPVFIWKHRPVNITKHNVSETGLCLRCNINRMVFSDKDRTMDNAQKHNFCTIVSIVSSDVP